MRSDICWGSTWPIFFYFCVCSRWRLDYGRGVWQWLIPLPPIKPHGGVMKRSRSTAIEGVWVPSSMSEKSKLLRPLFCQQFIFNGLFYFALKFTKKVNWWLQPSYVLHFSFCRVSEMWWPTLGKCVKMCSFFMCLICQITRYCISDGKGI